MLAPEDINSVVNQALTLVRHDIKLKSIKEVKKLGQDL